MEPIPVTGFVCGMPSEADVLAGAISISREYPEAQVYAATYRDHSSISLPAESRVTLVSAKIEALAEELMRESVLELIAKARHLEYVEAERRRGQGTTDNPSIVPWEQLHEESKESNRQFARSVTPTLRELGAALKPLTGAAPRHDLPIPSERLEALAIGEHDRWVQSRLDRGWKRTNGPKDDDRKLHPLLVPWDELPEEEREKDRDPFRTLTRMLAAVGYEIILPEGAGSHEH